MGYEYIYNDIPVGQENAIHMAALSDKWGVSISTVKDMVRQARLAGLDICSGNPGYWLAKNEEEKTAFLRLFNKQTFSRIKTSRPMRNSFKQIKGQMSLNFEQMGVSDNKWNG